jgi:hypothetical protein
MSQANDFARRLLADFLAARLEARPVEPDTPRPVSQGTNLTRSPHVKQASSLLTGHGDPGIVVASASE